MRVTKSGAACGAEIAFDLAQDIDDATFLEIQRAFHDNIVVVFRWPGRWDERQVRIWSQAQHDDTADLAHPIVRTHAYPGGSSLYVAAGECVGIEGMPDDEAVVLIA